MNVGQRVMWHKKPANGDGYMGGVVTEAINGGLTVRWDDKIVSRFKNGEWEGRVAPSVVPAQKKRRRSRR